MAGTLSASYLVEQRVQLDRICRVQRHDKAHGCARRATKLHRLPRMKGLGRGLDWEQTSVFVDAGPPQLGSTCAYLDLAPEARECCGHLGEAKSLLRSRRDARTRGRTSSFGPQRFIDRFDFEYVRRF